MNEIDEKLQELADLAKEKEDYATVVVLLTLQGARKDGTTDVLARGVDVIIEKQLMPISKELRKARGN